MRPTQRATEIAEPIRLTLFSLQNILDPQKFNPMTEKRVFRIAAVDYFSVIVAPKLANYLSQKAPGIDIRIIASAISAAELLDNGEADFVVGPMLNLPERFGSELLITDSLICMVREGHPLAGKTVTVQEYADAQHLVLSLRGDPHSVVDEELAKLNLSRRVAMTVSSSAVIPAIVEESDLIVTAPKKIIRRYTNPNSFIFNSPIQLPDKLIHLEVSWHKRLSVHPAHLWFKETLLNIASTL